MILDEYFDRKLNNLFINSRDQDWSVEEFGQYFADFRQIVADSEQKKHLSSRRLFREAFDCQSPSSRFRHYFKYILIERIICFEEFVQLLEGQSFKEIDIQLKLLKVIHESIEIILCPTNVSMFGNSLANFINWLLEIYLTSVENIPTKKQDISKKDLDVLNLIQQTLDKITNMNNFRYFRALLYVVKNDSDDKELIFEPIHKRIDEKMSGFAEQTVKKLYEDFTKTIKLLNCDKSDIIRQTQEQLHENNPFSTRLNNQNSIHLLSVWINVECIKFEVDDAVDRLLLLTKYFGLNFQTTMEVIMITNIQKFTEYQEPIPDETELSYYTFAYHRLVPFIKKFVDRRNEVYLDSSPSSQPMTNENISRLIIEILTNRIDWLKMIVNQMNGLLLVNFFFKLEKEKLVDSAQKLRQLIDPSFLDQSEETFFGKVLKFEQLINDFLDNKENKNYQISILHDLDIEISLLNFIISAKFMNKLENVCECLLSLTDEGEHFDSVFLIFISIILNDNNLDVLNALPEKNDSFTLKFTKYYLFRSSSTPRIVRKKFKDSFTQIDDNQEFENALNEKISGTISNQQFIFFVRNYAKKNLKIFLNNPLDARLDEFYGNFSKLNDSYQILGYLSIIAYIYKEPFKYLEIRKLLLKLKNILQNSEFCQKNDLLALIDRKCLKELKENEFIVFQEEKIEWNHKLLNNVKDSQTLTKQTMELYNDIFKKIGPRDFTRWITFTLFIGQHDVGNMDNAVRLAFLLFQNNMSECAFYLINIVAEWLLFKSHSTHDFDQTRDDLNRCLIKLMLMCVNAVIKLRLQNNSSIEMEYMCYEGEITSQSTHNDSMEVDNLANSSLRESLVITEFKRFLNDFVQINSSQDAIFRQTILTILFEETRNCFDEHTCIEFLPLFKGIVERLVKYATDGITYETIISFFPLDKQEFREHSANLLFLLNQSQSISI